MRIQSTTARLGAVMAAGLIFCMVSSANAVPLIVNSGNLWGVTGGEGSGRAQGIRADSSFQIQSLGIFGNLLLKSFDVRIHASTTGSDVGALLGSASAVTGGTGNGWNDIAINFSFTAGNFYVVNWRPTGGGTNWATTLDYYHDNALPVTVGPLTLVEGLHGNNAQSPSNFLHPNFRYDIVTAAPIPEPGTMALFGLGLAGLGFARRRKTA